MPFASTVHVPICRHRLKKRLALEFGLADASRLLFELVHRRGIVDLWRSGPAASGVEEGEFGGELDAAAAAGIKARVGYVGVDVVVVGFGEGGGSADSI
jgi:hypothetical protein